MDKQRIRGWKESGGVKVNEGEIRVRRSQDQVKEGSYVGNIRWRKDEKESEEKMVMRKWRWRK